MNYKEKIAMGLCGWCGENNENSKKLCEECGKISRDRTKKRASKLSATGKCRTCGKKLDKKGVRCKDCSKKHYEIGKKKTLLRRQQDLCLKCGGQRDSKHKHCEICRLKFVSKNLFGTATKWDELKTLFNEQKGKCNYSGLTITLGSDACIDHIVPRACGGNNDIENLHWTHKKVNQMKGSMAESEFLDIVARINEHHGDRCDK